MSPSRNKSTALAPTGDKVQRAGKRLTHDQAVKIRKLRLQRLQRIKKRQADHTITKMLNKLSLNPTIEKKRESTIKQRSEKLMKVKSKVDVNLEQENVTT